MPLRVNDLIGREAIPLARIRLIEEPGGETEPLGLVLAMRPRCLTRSRELRARQRIAPLTN